MIIIIILPVRKLQTKLYFLADLFNRIVFLNQSRHSDLKTASVNLCFFFVTAINIKVHQ